MYTPSLSLAVALLLAIVILILTVVWPLTRFIRLGVHGGRPWPIVGNVAAVLFRRKPYVDIQLEHYLRHKRHGFHGFFDFHMPLIVLTDPALIKQVTVRDFDHFVDRRPLIPLPDDEPLLGKSLFLLRGDRWRDMRTTLTPAFTGSKVRHMFHLVAETTRQLCDVLQQQAAAASVGGRSVCVELKDVTTRYAIDVIASTAFGLRVDSVRERDNMFYRMAKESLQFDSAKNLSKFALFNALPKFTHWLGLRLFTAAQRQFYHTLVHGTMRHREENDIYRPDMIQLLLEARNGYLRYAEAERAAAAEAEAAEAAAASEGGVEFAASADGLGGEMGCEDLRGCRKRFWSEDDVTAQCYLFVYAGYETTSTLLSFVAHELMENWTVQAKLIAELDEAKRQLNGQPLTYEVLYKLKYLDMVVSEALRKWPPNCFTDRTCSIDYRMTDAHGHTITVRKGDVLVLPIYAIQRDPDLYPDPERFDPERFSDERKHAIKPFTFLALGAGPRNCIGSRFVLMEVKTFLYYLLTTFTLEMAPTSRVPAAVVAAGWLYRTSGGLNVQLRLREEQTS